MLDLTYGRKKPETDDIGDEVFDALELNIDLNDAHTHDGITSAKISSSNITKSKQTLLSANWAATVNGLFKQTLTMIGGGNVEDLAFIFRDASDQSQLMLTYEQVGPAQVDVFINDNSKTVNVLYV